MLVKTYSCAIVGVGAIKVTVEVNLSKGHYQFISGLPDTAAICLAKKRERKTFRHGQGWHALLPIDGTVADVPSLINDGNAKPFRCLDLFYR